jgi:predicted transcriptional regulator
MTILSIRLPDDMAEKLKNIAKERDISLNKLMLELSAQILAEEDAKQRFMAAQLRGDPKRALQLLDELDALGLPTARPHHGKHA